MFSTLLLAVFATWAVVSPPAGAAEPAPVVLIQVPAPAPAVDPHRLLPQELAREERRRFYETAAVLAIAGGAGAVAAVVGGGGLTAMLVVGGAVGIAYLASAN